MVNTAGELMVQDVILGSWVVSWDFVGKRLLLETSRKAFKYSVKLF